MSDSEQPNRRRETRLVRDVMRHHVVGVVPEMTVRELIHVLMENSIAGAPVLDSRGKVIGAVSTTDVLKLAVHEAEIPSGRLSWDPVLTADEAGEAEILPGAGTLVAFTVPGTGALPEATFDQYQVRDIMTPVAFSVSPSDTLGTAVRFLLRGCIHRAFVIEDGVLEGIVTPFDLLQAFESE